MEFHHVSILLEPCLEALQIKPDGVYVDATTGGAGHSLRIAERLHDTGRLICIDRDDEALENAKDRLKDVWQRVTPVKSDFRDIDILRPSCCRGVGRLEPRAPSARRSQCRVIRKT